MSSCVHFEIDLHKHKQLNNGEHLIVTTHSSPILTVSKVIQASRLPLPESQQPGFSGQHCFADTHLCLMPFVSDYLFCLHVCLPARLLDNDSLRVQLNWSESLCSRVAPFDVSLLIMALHELVGPLLSALPMFSTVGWYSLLLDLRIQSRLLLVIYTVAIAF